MTCFEDRVACGCYPMDLHDPVTNTVVWKMPQGLSYPLPQPAPLGMKRTLAAGKCLSADPKAFGAVRVMPIMMNVGESAGYAAAYWPWGKQDSGPDLLRQPAELSGSEIWCVRKRGRDPKVKGKTSKLS